MAPNLLLVGAPSYGAFPGRMRCGPYGGEERNLQEVPSHHAAARRLTFAHKGEERRALGPATVTMIGEKGTER